MLSVYLPLIFAWCLLEATLVWEDLRFMREKHDVLVGHEV